MSEKKKPPDSDDVDLPKVDTQSFLDQEISSIHLPPPSTAGFDVVLSNEPSVKVLAEVSENPELSLELESTPPLPSMQGEAPVQSPDLQSADDFAPSPEPSVLSAEDPFAEDPFAELAPVEAQSPKEQVANEEAAIEGLSLSVDDSPAAPDLEAPAKEDSWGVQGTALEVSASNLGQAPVGDINLNSSEHEVDLPSHNESKSPEDLSVLKRYSSLKEREAREKETAVQVLKKQMEQIEFRLQKSETERRRLTMKLQEIESSYKAIEEGRQQDKHHISKMGDAQQEELRALQLRLDNAQFQASKAEKKLEEFRERVRNDIQKIRVRERELANRLELQKRDAEALLAAKDERLLQQKREIDRLEFEMETLQDRLIEETNKAEDRSQRLTRAMQSLRLAEGLLAGIQEEVLPNIGDGEGEAA